jgi:hypothetical protein
MASSKIKLLCKVFLSTPMGSFLWYEAWHELSVKMIVGPEDPAAWGTHATDLRISNITCTSADLFLFICTLGPASSCSSISFEFWCFLFEYTTSQLLSQAVKKGLSSPLY